VDTSTIALDVVLVVLIVAAAAGILLMDARAHRQENGGDPGPQP